MNINCPSFLIKGTTPELIRFLQLCEVNSFEISSSLWIHGAEPQGLMPKSVINHDGNDIRLVATIVSNQSDQYFKHVFDLSQTDQWDQALYLVEELNRLQRIFETAYQYEEINYRAHFPTYRNYPEQA